MPKIIAKNKRAYFDYVILDKYEAGLMLKGFEVKSVREGNINLKGAYATLKQINKALPEVWLINAHIPLYSKSDPTLPHDPIRSRKLLLNKREIRELIGKIKQKHLTLLPLTVYSKHGKIKVELGLGKGKKKHDKRQDLKAKEDKRAMQRAVRQKTAR